MSCLCLSVICCRLHVHCVMVDLLCFLHTFFTEFTEVAKVHSNDDGDDAPLIAIAGRRDHGIVFFAGHCYLLTRSLPNLVNCNSLVDLLCSPQ